MNTIMTIDGFGTPACAGTRISGARLRLVEWAVARTEQFGLPVVQRAALPTLVDNNTGVSVSGSRHRT